MRNFLSAIHLILTLNCQQSARLTCESFERKLSWSERTAVTAHHWICKSSRNLNRQLRAMEKSLRNDFIRKKLVESQAQGPAEIDHNSAAPTNPDSVTQLSPNAKARIRQAMQESE